MPTAPEPLAEYSEFNDEVSELVDDVTEALIELATRRTPPPVPPPNARKAVPSQPTEMTIWTSSLFTQKELIALLSAEEALTAFLDSSHPAVETIEALAILSDRELVDLINGKVPPNVMNALVACAEAMRRARSTP